MRHTVRLIAAGLVLAIAAGCGGGKGDNKKTGQSGPPVEPMEDSAYIEVQAQLTILGKGFPSKTGGVDEENPDYRAALEKTLNRLEVSMRDVDAHAEALSKSEDPARIQEVVMAISERTTEIEMGD